MEWNDALATIVLHNSLSEDSLFSELFCEHRETYEVTAENSLVQLAKSGIQSGIGIRIKKKYSQWHVFSEDLSEKGCLDLALTARNFSGSQERKTQQKQYSTLAIGSDFRNSHLIKSTEPFMDDLLDEFLLIIDLIEKAATNLTNKVNKVKTSIYVNRRSFLVLNSLGECAKEKNTRFSVSIKSHITHHNNTFTGSYASSHFGVPDGHHDIYQEASQKATHRALLAIESRPAPSGLFPVILAPGAGGLLFHEACGHALEGDMFERGSVFTGCIGDKIAADCITLIDSSMIDEGWGSYGYDDEGKKGENTVLIEKGILKNVMCDISYAQKLQQPNSGNGRRASYKHLPLPRMTNTYLMPSDHEPEEIIRDTSKGLYACEFRGGQVNPVTGDFSFFVEEGFAIRNGQLAEPVKGASILGNGRYILKNIDKVGNDLQHFPAMCIKAGQQIPVSVGQPTVKVKEMFVSSIGGR